MNKICHKLPITKAYIRWLLCMEDAEGHLEGAGLEAQSSLYVCWLIGWIRACMEVTD